MRLFEGSCGLKTIELVVMRESPAQPSITYLHMEPSTAQQSTAQQHRVAHVCLRSYKHSLPIQCRRCSRFKAVITESASQRFPTCIVSLSSNQTHSKETIFPITSWPPSLHDSIFLSALGFVPILPPCLNQRNPPLGLCCRTLAWSLDSGC